MKHSTFYTIQPYPDYPAGYWGSWGLSIGMHTVMVGLALLLSSRLPVPQTAEREPITISFFTPQITQPRTPPLHRQTMKKPPPTPTTKPEQVQAKAIPRAPVQAKAIPREPVQAKAIPREPVQAKAIPREPVQAKAIPREPVQARPRPQAHTKPRSQGHTKLRLQGHTKSRLQAQAKPHLQARAKPHLQARARHTAASRTIVQPSLKPLSHARTPPTGVTQRRAAATVHAQASHSVPLSSHGAPVHVNTTTSTRAPVARRTSIVRHHVAGTPQPVVSERPVVRARTTARYTTPTKKTRPAAVSRSRSVSTFGIAPELLAFSRLLREKIAQALVFPRLAKRLGYSGTTHVAISVSRTGTVRTVTISQPSGYDILDRAAVDTLRKVLRTTKPPESIEIEQLIVPIAFNLQTG